MRILLSVIVIQYISYSFAAPSCSLPWDDNNLNLNYFQVLIKLNFSSCTGRFRVNWIKETIFPLPPLYIDPTDFSFSWISFIDLGLVLYIMTSLTSNIKSLYTAGLDLYIADALRVIVWN